MHGAFIGKFCRLTAGSNHANLDVARVKSTLTDVAASIKFSELPRQQLRFG